jgi:hypothetical protein
MISGNERARQDALAILAATLEGDVGAVTAAMASCGGETLVMIALALLLFESLRNQGIPPADWVAAMRARPADEPGPANGLAWQN